MLTIAKLGRWSVSYYVDTAREATAAARDDRARNGGLGEYYSESETRLPTWLVVGEDAQRAAEQQQLLGQRGLARVGVRDDGEGAATRSLLGDLGHAVRGA